MTDAEQLEELLEFLYLAPVAIMKTTLDGVVSMANSECMRLLGPLTGGRVPNLFELIHRSDPDLVELLGTAEATGPVCQSRRVSFLTDVDELILSLDVFRSAADCLLIAFKDVTEIVSYERRLELQARTDELTGLANRRDFFELARGAGDAAVIMCDADHFKRVNDTYGHDGGDAVLRIIAETLREVARRDDVVARLGGEEFAVLVVGANLAAGFAVAERIRARIEATSVRHLEHDIRFTMSFGVAGKAAGASLTDALKRADEALYMAKNGGRNRVVSAPTAESIPAAG